VCYDLRMTLTVTTRMPLELVRHIDAAAKADKINRSALLRRLAEEHVQKIRPGRFACLDFHERFDLPVPVTERRAWIRREIARRYEKHR